MSPSRAHDFGPFHLDADQGLLFRGNERAKLGKQAVSLLKVLLEKPDKLISNEDLLAAAWPETPSLSESTVREHVRQIRKALGKYEDCIVNQPHRGYCFSTSILNKIMEQEGLPLALPKVDKSLSVEAPSDPVERNQQAEGSAPSIWHVPYARNPLFKGREAELQRLHDAFGARTESRVVQVLAGLPGLGKTSIAVEYAYRFRENYSLVWWLDASNEQALFKGYESLARRLKRKYDQHGVSAIDYLSDRLAGFAEWLLIFDDISSADDALSHLPKTGTGYIVITSSDRAWRARATVVDVPPLDPPSAIAFLNERLAGLYPRLDNSLVPELVAELGCVPAALEVASLYLEFAGCKITDYLRKVRALREESFLIAYEDSAELVVSRAWEMALRRAQCTCPAAFTLTGMVEWLDDCEIPLDLIEHFDTDSVGPWRSFPARIIMLLFARNFRKFLTPPLPPLPPLMASHDSFTFAEAIVTLERYSVVKVSERHFAIPSAIKVMMRTRQLKWGQRARWRTALSLTPLFVRAAMNRGDRESAALWIRHLRKVIAHSSTLGIPAEDAKVWKAHQALDELQEGLNNPRSNTSGEMAALPVKPSLIGFFRYAWTYHRRECGYLLSSAFFCLLTALSLIVFFGIVLYARTHPAYSHRIATAAAGCIVTALISGPSGAFLLILFRWKAKEYINKK